jgi:hypothetical protein
VIFRLKKLKKKSSATTSLYLYPLLPGDSFSRRSQIFSRSFLLQKSRRSSQAAAPYSVLSARGLLPLSPSRRSHLVLIAQHQERIASSPLQPWLLVSMGLSSISRCS